MTDLTIDPVPWGVLLGCGQHRPDISPPDGMTRKERRTAARKEVSR